MNRIDPVLFAACFMDWVVACWPEPLDAIAIDDKTVRRSHDRAKGRAALHLVSAFATNSRLVLGQEAVDDKKQRDDRDPCIARETRRRPQPRRRRGHHRRHRLQSADCPVHPSVGADYLLAVKGNQPTLQADVEAAFEAAYTGQVEVDVDVDKGRGRIETRTVSVLRHVDWLDGDRRFPGELRFPDAAPYRSRSL